MRVVPGPASDGKPRHGSAHDLAALVHDGLTDLHGLALGVEHDGRLLVPRVRCPRTPEASASGIVHAPAQRLEVLVAGVVIAGVELDAVSSRVAEVHEARMA